MRRSKGADAVGFLWEVVQLYFTKRVSRAAAELAYFLVLSFFPFVIVLNAVVGTLPVDLPSLLDEAAGVIPAEALGVIREYVGYITINQSRALLAAGIVMMLFSASAAMRSLMHVMDEIYDRRTYAGLWQVVASVAFAVLFLVTFYLSVVVVLTGNWFFHLLEELLGHFPALDGVTLPWQWQWMRFVILFCLVLMFMMLIYKATAPRGRPKPPVLTGAFLASGALVGFSVLFSYFISLSSRYSLVYGSLASVVILLVWLYLCGNIVIVGNCFNRVWYGRKWRPYLEDEA